MALHPFNPVRSALATLTLVVLGLALAGCRNADSSTTAQADLAHPQIKTETASNLAQDNIDRYSFDELITGIFTESPLIAVVRDQAIRSHDLKDVDPDNEETGAFHQFDVTLVEALKGEFPSSFSFYSSDNDYDGPATRNDRPYMVALCRMGDKFYADIMIGRLPSHILGFDALMRQRLATAEPANFGPEACAFDFPLPE